MSPIRHSIDSNSPAEDISNLQDALAALLALGNLNLSQAEANKLRSALTVERAGTRYGDATISLVGAFRKARDLEPGEIVDTRTAESLNEALVDAGLLARVDGRLVQDGRRGLPGMSIFLFQPGHEGLFADGKTDVEGAFRVWYDPAIVRAAAGEGVSPWFGVFAYRGADEVIASERVDDPPARVRVDLVVGRVSIEAQPAQPPADTKSTTQWTIHGRVVDDEGPVTGTLVRAIDRDFGAARQTLGEQPTDADGQFRIDYDAQRFLAGEADAAPRKPTPDLLLEIVRDGAPVRPLSIGRVFPGGVDAIDDDDRLAGFPARADEALLIRLPARGPAGPVDEYTRLWQAIEPALPEPAPAGADPAQRERAVCNAVRGLDEAGRRDVTFLAREIDWPRELVLRFVAASRSAVDDFDRAVTPAERYALAAAGYPDLRSLATAPMTALVAALRSSDGVVPPIDEARAAQVAEIIARSAARRLVDPAMGEARPHMAKALTLVGLDAARQSALLRTSAQVQGTVSSFWKALRDDPVLKDAEQPVRYAMTLSAITGQQLPLMQAIVTQFPDARSLRALMMQLDLGKLDTAVRASGVTIDAAVPGRTDEDRQTAFTMGLFTLLRAADPTAAVVYLARSLSAEPGAPVSADAAGLLARVAAEQPEFDLFHGSIEQAAGPGTAAADEQAPALGELKRLQRLARISTSERNLSGLLRTTLGSAVEITRRYTRTGFVAALGEALGGADEAELAYRRSVAVSTATLSLAVHANQLSLTTRPSAVASAQKATRRWSGLGGTTPLCECEHCRSWVSPAAYLVDMLMQLDRRHDASEAATTPLDVLLARRPDIAHLKLSCENTNTTLPMIDLVNEVLENHVVLGDQGFAGFKGHDVTDETADELRAEPRHLEEKAVEALAAARFPMGLPFDRWLELARALLAEAKVPRHALMSAFASTEAAGKAPEQQIASESLGLSPVEHALVTGTTTDGRQDETPLDVLLGFPAGTDEQAIRAELTSAQALQTRLSLDFRELVALWGTGLMNPMLVVGDAMQALLARFGLDAKTLQAYVTGGGQPDAALIARLAERGETPASLQQALDAAIDATRVKDVLVFGGTEGDPAAIELRHLDGSPPTAQELRRATGLVRLRRRLGGSFEDLDRTLRALGCTDRIDAGVLRRLADARALATRLGCAVVELLPLWSDLDLRGGGSYRALFESRIVGVEPSSRLALTLRDGRLANAAPPLSDELAAVARAMGLSEQALDALVQAMMPVTGYGEPPADPHALPADPHCLPREPVADPPTLSRLHRHVLAQRLWSLSPSALGTLARLSGETPFGDPAATLRWVDALACVQGSGMPVDGLPAALAATPDAKALADDPALQAFLRDLDERLAKARAPEPGEQPPRPDGAVGAPAQATPAGGGAPPAQGGPAQDGPTQDDPAPMAEQAAAEDAQARADQAKRRLQREVQAVLDAVAAAFGVSGETAQTLMDAAPARPEDGSPAGISLAELLRRRPARHAPPAGERGPSGPDVQKPAAPAEPAEPAAGAPASEPLLRAVHALRRGAGLVTRMKLGAADLRALQAASTRFGGLHWLADHLGAKDERAGFAIWRRVAGYLHLRNRLTPRTPSLADVIAAPAAERRALLAQATGWSPATIAQAFEVFGLDDDALGDEQAIAHIEPALALAAALGVSVGVASAWAFAPPGRATVEQMAAATRVRVGDARWPEVAARIHDPLRERHRDALVAHLLQQPAIAGRGIRDANGLFEHFLIDVGTSACATTSRIVQASASIQLFVQRALLGLEGDAVPPQALDEELWAWMKNYRVWEANRRIFLYPENYLLPELRDDRSPFFRELQAELGEGELGRERIERAVVGYLGKLESVSRLEIVGTCRYVESSPPRDVLHVFGRTMSAVPRRYFYRRLSEGEWSHWEPLDVDIQGVEVDDDNLEGGVHLLPVVWRGKLYLFWPQFVKCTPRELPKEVDGSKLGAASGLTIRPPVLYWEIKLAWSRQEDGRWSTKQLSDVVLTRPVSLAERPRSLLSVAVEMAVAGLGDKGGQSAPRPPSSKPTFQRTIADSIGFHVDAEASTAFTNLRKGRLTEVRLQSELGSDGSLTIHVIDRTEGRAAPGAVVFADPYSAPQRRPGDNREVPDIVDGRPTYQARAGALSLAFKSASAGLPATTVLGYSPSGWKVTPLAQHGAPPLASPVFVGDGTALYFAELQPRTQMVMVPQVGGVVAATDPRIVASLAIARDALDGSSSGTVAITPASRLRGASPWTRASAELLPGRLGLALAAASDGAVPDAVPDATAQSLPLPDRPSTWATLAPDWRARLIGEIGLGPTVQPSVGVRFHPFFHPQAADLAERVRRNGLDTLFTLEAQPDDDHGTTFAARYQPITGIVETPYPSHGMDFDPGSPYGPYNWELFYHVPVLIADTLRKAGHYREALDAIRWVFDPFHRETEDAKANDGAPDNDAAQDFVWWRTRPLRQAAKSIARLFDALEPGADDGERQRVLEQLERMLRHPFQPFRIARTRVDALQTAAIMLFCDICFDAGDALYRQDTRESVGEALQYYVLIAHVLGERRPRIPPIHRPAPRSFAELRGRLNPAGQARVEAENDLLFAGIGATLPAAPGISSLLSIGTTDYFCIPPNDKLAGYWDKVDDRLYKLRHCMNIDGIVRQLDLFAPPIDPMLLARAAAAGVSVGDAIADVAAPLPRHRFATLLQKALEVTGELKSLSAALLAALEKKDTEHLTLLRTQHETALLEKIALTRQWQVTEAQAGVESMLRSREQAMLRLQHFSRLLGVPVPAIPGVPEALAKPTDPIPVRSVIPPMTEAGRFELVSAGKITLDGAALGAAAGGLVAGPAGSAVGAALGSALGDIELADLDTGTRILSFERDELWQSFLAAAYTMGSTGLDGLGTVLGLIPQAEIAVKPLGIGGGANFGGHQLSAGAHFGGSILRAVSSWHGFKASVAARQAGFVWRHQDQMLQLNAAALEIGQLDQQIIAARIREKIAANELAVHQQQMIDRNSELEVQRAKFTNEQRYALLERALSQLLRDGYRLAFDWARQAERALSFQLGEFNASYISRKWDTERRGLLCGEDLYQDLKRMEHAFMRDTPREYELTRHVSLAQLDPGALIRLRLHGRCRFELPEWLFDLDFPTHYFRRIRSVAVTLPCVTGPYTGVAGTLTLESSTVRTRPVDDDNALKRDILPQRSIATSSGQTDTGTFELGTPDDRFLPFEGAGVFGVWRFELPQQFAPFDYQSISDLVLQIRFTSREGGERFGKPRVKRLKDALRGTNEAPAALLRMFSLRHEFPMQWRRLTGDTGEETGIAVLDLTSERLPLLLRGAAVAVREVEIITIGSTGGQPSLKLAKPDGAVLEADEATLLLKDCAYQTIFRGLSVDVTDPTKPKGWTVGAD